jgi:glutathione S-transferase
VAKQKAIFGRALDQMEKEVDTLPAQPTIGTITFGCVCGYLDFRFAADDWRAARPKLAKWYAEFAKRPSMSATVPRDAK